MAEPPSKHTSAPPKTQKKDKPEAQAPGQRTETPYQEAPDFPLPIGEVLELLDAWIQDGAIKLPYVRREPTEEDMENPRYCRFHRFVNHPTSSCKVLKRIFREKVESGELNLGAEGVHIDPLPVRTFSISEEPVKEAVQSLIEHVCELLYLSKAQRGDMFTALNYIVSGKCLLISEVPPEH